jgi:hypothetical protein
MTSADHMTASPLAAAGTAATVGVPLGSDHDSSPHGAGHLWALCLAVLAAGLALLLLALVRRSLAIRLPLLPRANRTSVGLVQPAPAARPVLPLPDADLGRTSRSPSPACTAAATPPHVPSDPYSGDST